MIYNPTNRQIAPDNFGQTTLKLRKNIEIWVSEMYLLYKILRVFLPNSSRFIVNAGFDDWLNLLRNETNNVMVDYIAVKYETPMKF